MTRRVRFLLLASSAIAVACNHDSGSGPIGSDHVGVPPPAGGVAQFTAIPVDMPDGSNTALGNLNPPGHVLPTDHVYFYPHNLAGPGVTPGTILRNVYAPATGAVDWMLQPGGTDWKIDFVVTDNFHYYLDHVLPLPNIKVGAVVQAGDLIGTTDPDATLDLGAYDNSVSHAGFLTPARYPSQTLHYVSPWKYFVEPLRSQMYAKVYRAPTASDKDGKIDFGIAGRLVGDWYLQGLLADSSPGPSGWPRTVAFVYDYYNPSQVRISIGGTIAPPGVWAIDSTAPRPENVAVASGLVAYRLRNPFDAAPPYGLMLVQMVSDSQIRVEVFVGSTASTGQFDGNAFTYVR